MADPVVSFLHQLRSRETLRHSMFLPRPEAAPVRRRPAAARGGVLRDGLSAGSYFASCVRNLPSHHQHLLLGHTGCVNAVAVSPDPYGRFVATGGDDLRALVWEARAPLKAVFPKDAHHEPCALDAPSATAAIRTSAYSHPVRAGFISQKFTQSFTGHAANIFGLAFSADSRRLISCGLDAQIHLYDLTTGGDMSPSSRSFRGHNSSVHRVCFQTESSDVFFSASNDKTVRLWDIRAGNQSQFAGGFAYGLNSVHCSPADPNLFATAGRGLCLHDVRRMAPTAHNVDAAQAAHATPRRTRAQTRRLMVARNLAVRTRYVLDGDSPDVGMDEGEDEDPQDEQEEEDDFTSLVEFIVSGGSPMTRPMASIMEFDTTTQLPIAPALPARPPARRSSRSATRGGHAAASSSTTHAASSSRGRGCGGASAQRGRGSRSRSRSRAAEAEPEEEAPAAGEAEEDEVDMQMDAEEIFPTARRQPQLDVSSCEFSSDGRSIAVCMMEGRPMVFDIDRKEPVLCLQSVNAFAGYTNTCTMKAASFAGPGDRFVVGGADNFGIYFWDRALLRSDILASPQTNPENTSTFLNACKIVRGHRSVGNNQRYHPQLMQLFSCGVEKVVRAFHLTRPQLTAPHSPDDERDAEQLEDGDLLPRSFSRSHSPAPASDHRKRKSPATTSIDDPSAADEKKRRPSQASPGDEMEDVSSFTTSAASASSTSAAESRPRRRAAVAADAALAASSGPRRRSARNRTPTPPVEEETTPSSASAAARAAARAAAQADPLYRMVRQYCQPRVPFSRLQCAYVLSGGSDWSFGAAASMFADGADEEDAGESGNDSDSMGEDRQCMAQFDFYFLKAASGEMDSDEEEEEEESDDEGDDSDLDSDGGPATTIELTQEQMARLRDTLSRPQERADNASD